VNHQQARSLLNDHVDGLLSDRQGRALEAHLRQCPDCRTEAARLRALLDRAAALPDSLEPGRDLWPDIAAAIARSNRPAVAPAPTEAAGRTGSAITSGERGVAAGLRRWFIPTARGGTANWRPAFSVAVLILLAMLTALVFHDPRHASGPDRSATPLAGQTLDPLIAGVLDALEVECPATEAGSPAIDTTEDGDAHGRSILDLITSNLRIIDRAIADARAAWSADPQSPHLARLLASAYRARASLQRQRSRIAAQL
jgi:anti-sigma factor RsiW